MGEKVKRLLLFGPPGAGKGTQAAFIAHALGIPHIDTGSIIRENIREKTPLGLEAKAYVEKGELVPDELVIRLVKDRLGKPDAKDGFLLDGFPRSLVQAEALSKMGSGGTEIVDRVVFINVDEDILIERLSSRRICSSCKAVYNMITIPPVKDEICDKCGGNLIRRPDDSEEAIRNRFRVYREETSPISVYYRDNNLLTEVGGMGTVEEVTSRILKSLNP